MFACSSAGVQRRSNTVRIAERTLQIPLGIDNDTSIILEVNNEPVLPAERLALTHNDQRVSCTHSTGLVKACVGAASYS